MRRTLSICLAIAAAGIAAAVAPTLAQRSFDPGIVSAEKVTSIDSDANGTWALTSSGKVLYCVVSDDKSPKVVCFDKGGRTGIDY